jgi:hypothetical protein
VWTSRCRAYEYVDYSIISVLHPEIGSYRISAARSSRCPTLEKPLTESAHPRIIPATGYEARYETQHELRTTRTHYPVVAIAIDGTSGKALVLNKWGKLVEPDDPSMKEAGRFSRVVPAKWSNILRNS